MYYSLYFFGKTEKFDITYVSIFVNKFVFELLKFKLFQVVYVIYFKVINTMIYVLNAIIYTCSDINNYIIQNYKYI